MAKSLRSSYNDIINMYKNGASISSIAKIYKTKPQNISYIIKKYPNGYLLDNTDKLSDDELIEKAASNLKEKTDKQTYVNVKEVEIKLAIEQIKLLKNELSFYKAIDGIQPKGTLNINIPTSKTSNSTGILILSDWHVDEEVKSDSVNGLNEYNPTIVQKRVNKLLNSFIKIINIERHGATIDDCVILILGDMITSYLHTENESGNSLTPIDGIIFARDLLFDFISKVYDVLKFKKMTIIGKPGNHARLTKEKRTVNLTGLNLESLLHDSLYKLLLNKYGKDINYIYDPGYYTYFDVYGYVFRAYHGDNVKYNAGVGGISVPANRMVAKLNRSKPAYYDIMGHHHQYGDYGSFIINGSLIGVNSYALYHGLGSGMPSQAMFLVHPKYGKTVTWPIYV